ncbi:MAG TPA: AraD1 family protein [Bryobacteraceae bacterium]|jgi:hypothetical protein
MRLLQIADSAGRRSVGVVEEPRILLLDRVASIYELAQEALAAGTALDTAAQARVCSSLDYDAVYHGTSPWHILPAMDHPHDPAHCLISGTGLTHRKSAQNRQAMHAAGAAPTDSMRMYQWGVEGGRPEPGSIGVSPEWFYKGSGDILRAPGEPLTVPPHADDGGEEPEIAGIYLIDQAGTPRRLGMAAGNEFSDHCFEKKNYLYLAASKLMTCAIGPELVTDPDFSAVAGEVSIERAGQVIWSKPIASGDAAMSHSLENLEHHHFKHAAHRRPGDVHIHFFGADAFSFGEGLHLEADDVMQVRFDGFGRPLRNPLAIDRSPQKVHRAVPL